jgi:hypothetical protein
VAGLFFLVRMAAAQSIYEDYTFTTLAGPDEAGPGWLDGATNAARFGTPAGVARDNQGNIYVADALNNTIRKITPDGMVSTVAGETGVAGSADGVGFGARFNGPYGIAVDGNGNIFVADTSNDTIRKISPGGVVTTFAGLAGVSGSANGTGSAARFNNPYGLMVDGNNNLYVADTMNSTIRKITPAGVVTTFAGKAGVTGALNKTGTSATFTRPVSIAMDSHGNIYVADTGNDLIRKISPGAVVTTLAGAVGTSGSADGTNGTARFTSPYGITVDNQDNIYVADTFNDTIRKITLTGVVTTLAGSAGIASSADGVGKAARFSSPTGIAAGNGTDLVVADFGNSSIRTVLADGTVNTVAGVASSPGSRDGSASDARFNFPAGVALDSAGNIYVADEQNDAIRKVTPTGDVSTFVGQLGVAGTNDGASATFKRPLGVAFDPAGNLIVADTQNHAIRKVTPNGVVSTLAGLPGTSGTNDGVGTDARFNTPFSVAVDAQTNIYVADTFNHAIRKITPDGMVTTIAGTIGTLGTNNGTGLNARFAYPEGMVVDPDGNIFVVDNDDFTIRKITPDGVVTTFVGTPGSTGNADGVGAAARFNFPFGLAIDANRNLYVADTANHIIRKVTPAGSVTTLGGLAGIYGNADGTGNDARLHDMEGLAVDGNGTLYVADTYNHIIRKAIPALPDVPTVDFTAARVGVTRHFAVSNLTTTSWSWDLIRRPGASLAQLSATNSVNPTFTPDAEDVYVVRFQGWDNSGRTIIRTLTLYADDTAPSLAITNPVAGQISSNGVFTVSGTASDNLAVSNVWVQLNGGAWTKAAGTASWSLGLTLAPGTNVIQAYAEDMAGNVSPTNEVDLFYVVSAPLTVHINGGGTVTPDYNGVLLEIGQTYSITAQPGPGSEFVNWTDSITTNSPTLTFVMESNLTFTANFTDVGSPTLAITSPTKGQFVSNAVITATGTATDNGQLAAVWYQLNGGGWIQATNTTNWTAGLTLVSGANTLAAYAIDTFNNISATNTVTFTYVPSSQILVFVSGFGTVTPNYNGALLAIGKSYTMTAKPHGIYVFSRWLDGQGNTLSKTPAFTFLVQSNMAVEASFIVNPFASLLGPYAGLFYDTNNISPTNSGFVSISMTSVGRFSTKIRLASGKSFSFSGEFPVDGTYSKSIGGNSSSPFLVQLAVDTANARITGSVSNSGWVAPLTAIRADYSAVHRAPQANKKYVLVIPGGDDSSVQPAGNGFGTIGVSISGNLSFQGTLADGSKAAEKTFISRRGEWPFYQAAPGGSGVILGWLTFTNESNSDLGGLLYWVKQPQAGRLYQNGFVFPDGIEAVGCRYAFTNGAPLLNLPAGGVAILQQGNLSQSFTNNFVLGANNKVTSTNGLSMTITTKSGLFKGTAQNPAGGDAVRISGILLPKQNAGYGFFLGTNQSGAVYFGP